MDALWGALHPISEECLIICDHEEEIVVGDHTFTAWHTPGHARHHIAWQLDNVLFTGDVAGIKIDGGLIVPPCPPPDINLEDWNHSIALIRKSSVDTLYLTHFGMVEDVNSHLDSLQFMLNDWAQWMKPYAEAQSELSEVTPLFEQYVASQLKEHGLTGQAIEQYEAANPSWMSVSGLMRYWRKKKID
jgi:glyoxylase-like metal-dependent hydrolase (beta-lactamase superfamily II)